MNRKRIGEIFLMLLLLSSSASAAEEPRFFATADKTLLGPDDTLTLTLTVTGAQKVSPPQLPAIEGLQLLYGPSVATQTSIVNGVVSTRRVFEYGFSPAKTGSFTIPSIAVEADGKKMRSEPIRVEVRKGVSAAPAGGQEPAPQGPTEEEISKRLFVELFADKTEAAVNEQIVLTFRFYRSLSVDDVRYEPPATRGFIEEDLGKQISYRKVIDGIEFEVIELKKALFPVSSGTLEISPARLGCSILLKAPSRRRASTGSLFDEFLSDPFSDSFFYGGRYVKRPVELVSDPVTIRVRPLPAEGRPASFADAVGQFELEVQAAPLEAAVGDPVTLTMKIHGSGNLQSVKAPSSSADPTLFRTYEPESKTQILERENGIVGEKVFEKVLIPLDPSVAEIPAVEFGYYDPTQKSYRVLAAGPFPLKVLPASPKPIQIVSGPAEGKKEVMLIEKDIFYIRSEPGRMRPAGERLPLKPWFAVSAAGPWLLFGAAWLWLRRRDARLADPALARRARAAADAFGLFKGASAAREYKEVCAGVQKGLETYVAAKLGIPRGAVLVGEIAPRLLERGLSPASAEELKRLFSDCELGRFGADAAGGPGGRELAARAKKWVASAERKLR